MARILVVDDVRFISQMLAALFEQRGHVVQVAQDGAEALERVEAWSPDWVPDES